MTASLTRRAVAVGLLAPAAACATVPRPDAAPALRALEQRAGGRLGVAVHVFGGARTGWRADQRFGMCSTFKAPLAGLVLAAAERGELSLDAEIPVTPADMVMHAPSTTPFLNRTMTVRALAEAAQKTSDNVAANLLLKKIGGPEGFTARLRALGDTETRLDRIEPAMNLVPLGEVRDTTTPDAFAATMARFASGDALTPASRALLVQWMIDTTTGLKRLRAGFPADWRAGDKTGTALAAGMPNKTNDVAVAWPPGGAPVVIAAFYEGPASDSVRDEDQAVLAEVGRIAAGWVAGWRRHPMHLPPLHSALP